MPYADILNMFHIRSISPTLRGRVLHACAQISFWGPCIRPLCTAAATAYTPLYAPRFLEGKFLKPEHIHVAIVCKRASTRMPWVDVHVVATSGYTLYTYLCEQVSTSINVCMHEASRVPAGVSWSHRRRVGTCTKRRARLQLASNPTTIASQQYGERLRALNCCQPTMQHTADAANANLQVSVTYLRSTSHNASVVVVHESGPCKSSGSVGHSQTYGRVMHGRELAAPLL